MLTVLQPIEYPRVRNLLGSLLEYNVILDAVLDGSSPAWVAADQSETPGGVFLATAEGYFLAGNPDQAAFVDDLRTFFHRAMTEEGYWRGSPILYLNYYPDGWKRHFAEIFGPQEPYNMERQHYICTTLRFIDWRAQVPAGYRVERIDQRLLEQTGLTIPEHVTDWMESNWGSVEAFMQRGFGFGTVHEGAIVSWSEADCVSGARCEIGIQTQPDYRRRGLASLTAAAAVEYALASGIKEVRWHCNADNLGSVGTALKVGFEKERDYVYTCFVLRKEKR